ncbi:MAG: hypothetical protein CM15mP8_0380 [Methanobacteriota archaeon]|nr:MAG: hypothetical protein CM15mP8_0380 [Euryarchaeota archaeon]
MANEPQSAVFTTVLWDGGSKYRLQHLNRLKKQKSSKLTPNNL